MYYSDYNSDLVAKCKTSSIDFPDDGNQNESFPNEFCCKNGRNPQQIYFTFNLISILTKMWNEVVWWWSEPGATTSLEFSAVQFVVCSKEEAPCHLTHLWSVSVISRIWNIGTYQDQHSHHSHSQWTRQTGITLIITSSQISPLWVKIENYTGTFQLTGPTGVKRVVDWRSNFLFIRKI